MSDEPVSAGAGGTQDLARVWDVVIVGSGMGGATLGYALARRGRSVLFLEKGRRLHATAVADANPQELLQIVDPHERLLRGTWPDRLRGMLNGTPLEFFAPLGCGTGGSSTLYAAQLERMQPIDFTPRATHPRAVEANLPERWPIHYEQLAEHYEAAERLFEVCGGDDPLHRTPSKLRNPPPLSPRDTALMELLVERGLHPYRAHVACRYLPSCAGCAGRFCPRACKVDAAWGCLLPALAHDAALMSDTEVTHLEADARRVTRVHCVHQGQPRTVQGRMVVLAAGAWSTPALLLRSSGKLWPKGLANGSDQVGRNLMVHVSDYFALRPRRHLPATGPGKSIALNDFYVHDGTKLGTVHNIGVPIDYGTVRWFLHERLRHYGAARRLVARAMLRPMAAVGSRLFSHASVFAFDLEDLPYRDNRVELAPGSPTGWRFAYRYRTELHDRVRMFRRALVAKLGRRHLAFLTGPDNLNFGHVCGTCRFGDDHRESVLNSDNRAHEVDNLYVVDASFFPTSGGTNPSLTIAANALRVAELMHGRL